MIGEFAVADLLCGTHDRLGAMLVEQTKLLVDFSTGPFDNTKCADERRRNMFSTYPEVSARPLRLRSPQSIGRDLDWPKSVVLGARIGHNRCRRCD